MKEYNSSFFNFSRDEKQLLSAADVIKRNYPRRPLACVRTFGCQMNVSDSEKIKGVLELIGYGMTEDVESADFIIFNTCAVRDHAEQRVLGNIGALKRLKAENPGLLIAICGCMPQRPEVIERIRRSYHYIDIAFGTNMIHRLPELIARRLETGRRVIVTGLNDKLVVEGLPAVRDFDYKAWLPIMYGCNNFCTYCVVPYVRGREVSRKPEDIIEDAKRLVDSGAKDITLLGQNVNSYDGGISFAELLRRVNEIDGDFMIRFMTSHPKDCGEELLSAMAECGKVERHLHLPVQSGSDRILKAMNRKYTVGGYLELIGKAKRLMPDISLTSDIIVGFPGETYEDFCGTLDVVKKVRYLSLFTFIFSPRDGTPAAEMPDPVSREEKGRWFSELIEAQDGISKELCAEMIGKKYRVLCTGEGRKPGFMAGQTSGGQVIEFPGEGRLTGRFIDVSADRLSDVVEGSIIK